jgi:hypothetical protein
MNNEEEQELLSVEVPLPELDPAAERAELASSLLDELGRVEVDYRIGITGQAAMFVEDMQQRLEEARARRIPLACSERQLAWLESIKEKLES